MRTAKMCRRLAAVPLLGLAGLLVTAVPSLATVGVPDEIVTDAASGVTATSAVLNGSVNPESTASVSVSFMYGVGAPMNTVQATPLNPTGMVSVFESAAISGLTPGITYSFEIVVNGVPGNIVTFTTPVTSVATTPPVINTVAGCTDALVAYVRAHGYAPATVTAGYASGFIACEGLTAVQLTEAAQDAVAILTPVITTTPTPAMMPTPTTTVTEPAAAEPVVVPVEVPVVTEVPVGTIPVGAPATGGGTGSDAGIIAMGAAGALALAGGGTVLVLARKR